MNSTLNKILGTSPTRPIFYNIILWLFCFQCCTCNAESITIKGKISYGSLVGGALQAREQREFLVHLSNCQWQIITHEINLSPNKPIQYETTCDSSNVFFVVSFNTNAQKNVEIQSITRNKVTTNIIAGTKAKPINSAAAVVFPGIFPDPIGDRFATVLWEAFASTCYLDLQTNETLPPPFILNPERRSYEMKVKANWRRFNAPPYLPSIITYYNDGFYYAFHSGHVERTRYTHPYDEGFTNAIFHVIQSTNLNGLVLPAAFEFVQFAPVEGGLENSQLIAIGKYEAIVSKISLDETSNAEINAVLPPKSLVRDERFETNLNIADGALYYSANGKWLTKKEMEEINLKGTDVSGNQHMAARIIVISLLTLITVVFLFMSFKSWRLNSNRTKQQ